MAKQGFCLMTLHFFALLRLTNSTVSFSHIVRLGQQVISRCMLLPLYRPTLHILSLSSSFCIQSKDAT